MGLAQNLNDLEKEDRNQLTTEPPLLPVPGWMALRVSFLKVLALLGGGLHHATATKLCEWLWEGEGLLSH